MHWPRNLYSWIALLHDVFMAAMSLWLAHYLRLGDLLLSYSGSMLPLATLGFVPLCLLIFVSAGLYRGLWRYASMQDVWTLARAVTAVLLIFYLGLFIFFRLEGVPRSVPFIHWLVLMALLGGSRFIYRAIKDTRLGMKFSLAGIPRIPVLLIGANDAAELFIRETRRNPQAAYHVVGLVDEDSSRRGQQVHQVRIYGGSEHLQKIVGKLERKGRKPQRVVLADAEKRTGAEIRALLAECHRLGLPLSRLPRILDLHSGVAAERAEIQPIAIEDLLQRSQHIQDLRPVESLVAGKTVLITGAGGTIGSEITRQIAGFHPRKIILLEHAEFQLYTIERVLADSPHRFEIVAVLGDVRDAALLEKIFVTHNPQLVFHAAALKHVPLAEENPEITLSVNVLGTYRLAQMAARYAVEHLVLISTDKAVHPTSVMGASKRFAEKIMQHFGADCKRDDCRAMTPHKTYFSTVRFGNVLGSTGSVVPRFQEQLAKGLPLTVTHPDMTRYFMTVREAVELVLQTAAMGAALPQENGGIFVLDMGDPVKIEDLAKQMFHLAGIPAEKAEIVYTGLRAGEKMHEALFYEAENLHPTPHQSIRLAREDASPLQEAELQQLVGDLEQACKQFLRSNALRVLHKAVAEYTQTA
jgi:O-antigen biosynthesis protein WbqV